MKVDPYSLFKFIVWYVYFLLCISTLILQCSYALLIQLRVLRVSFTSCFTVIYRSRGAGLLYHMTFQEVHTRRRKKIESKHHGAAEESTSEQQRFDRTEWRLYT